MSTLATSAVNIYVRDTRYLVESFNAVLFWVVPIFYGFEMIPAKYTAIVLFNPIAALVMALRNILLDATSPAPSLLIKLCGVSLLTLVIGMAVFNRLKRRFYDYL